jgi:hypothetical protein
LFNLRLKSGTQTNRIDIRDICTILNSINIYIENGYNIELIDESRFFKKDFPKLLLREDLFKYINNLEFKFYSNCESRVGKDDKFWYEAEISNFPRNSYLKKFLIDILVNDINYGVTIIDENKILLDYDYSFAYYSCTREREEMGQSIREMDKIKDILKMGALNTFNSIEELAINLMGKNSNEKKSNETGIKK